MKYFILTLRFLLLLISCPLYCLKVAVFNVGQGNCTVITAPNQPTLIVDAGSSQFPRDANGKILNDSILEEIKEHIQTNAGNNQLAVIISHPDIDHGNWINDIVSPLIDEEFEVTALLGGTREDYQARKKRLWPFIKALEDKCQEHEFTFQYCDQVENIKEFCTEHMPAYCSILSAKHDAKDNDKSIVMKISYEDFSFLLPGDATKSITDTIRKSIIKSDMLMLAHHGAARDGCTTIQLLRKVNPGAIIASSGMNKGYKHVPGITVATVAKYFRTQPHVDWHPHPINYYDDGSLKNAADSQDVKQIITYKDGFATGITQLPFFTTTTSGTICITNGDTEYTIDAEHYSDGSESPTTIALDSLNRKYFADFSFDSIKQLNFTNLELNDETVIANFKTLPLALTSADFSENNLTVASVKHFAKLMAKKAAALKIVLNIPYKKADKEETPLLQSVVERFRKNDPAPARTLHHLRREVIDEKYKTIACILPKSK